MEANRKKMSVKTKRDKKEMSRLSDPTGEYHFRVFRVGNNLFEGPEDEQAHWLCHALGLAGSSTREVGDSIASTIFCEILAAAKVHQGLTNDELSKRVGDRRVKKKKGKTIVRNPSRGTIAYHAARLEKTGIVVRRGRYWELREYTLERTLQRMKEDIDRFMDDILTIARKMDEK